MNNLGVLYFNGTGAQRDVSVARSWFERAIALRNSDAVQNLRIVQDSIYLGGNEIGKRRASCSQSCTMTHQSYVNSVCVRPSTTLANSTEREKCISASFLPKHAGTRVGHGHYFRKPKTHAWYALEHSCLAQQLRTVQRAVTLRSSIAPAPARFLKSRRPAEPSQDS